MQLHILWDSNLAFFLPGNVGSWRWWIYLALISFVGSWDLALLLVQEGLREVAAAKDAPSAADEVV